MRSFSTCLLLSFIALAFSCKKAPNPFAEKGVSFELNVHRKQTIDSIQYVIELDIPALKSQAIRGKETISFNLKKSDQPVMLDFSADSSHLISVKSAGKHISYSFANEHIIIDPDVLIKGEKSNLLQVICL
jgi:aminopeptidase N